ncbi:hypothetical protein COV18_04875 [Candidatus Woesearchaeota archaeon CG10_big_fil_rev_8_21_14_0_10_37_12]|nr:MAG: hypothetical protein COV18_04875 [Candidatus Woesearchaeota archaeon CG10_big_fil_rev_8_21_14_0_10_37_12]
MKDYLALVLGSLKKRILRTMLTALGIIIGIAAVVALISLGQGMADAINAQFSGVGADKIIIQGATAGFGPPGQDTPGKVDEDDLEIVKRTPGVSRAAGRILQSVTVEYADTTQTIFAASLPEKHEDRDLVIGANNIAVADGRLLKPTDNKKILVGYHYWTEEHFPRDLQLGKSVLINGENFEIVGFLKKIGAGRDESIMMNEKDLRELTKNKKEYSALFAQIVTGEKPSQIADKIQRAIRKDRHQKEGFEDFTVTTSEELISSVNVILGVVQGVFIGIALISILVGGIGIMNTMYTSVLERTREIGVMKAIGAQNKDILILFVVESGILGMVGGAIGILIGFGLSKLVELASQNALGDILQASFSWQLIIGALLFSFIIGTISGIFPARQASKLQPVEALRND